MAGPAGLLTCRTFRSLTLPFTVDCLWTSGLLFLLLISVICLCFCPREVRETYSSTTSLYFLTGNAKERDLLEEWDPLYIFVGLSEWKRILYSREGTGEGFSWNQKYKGAYVREVGRGQNRRGFRSVPEKGPDGAPVSRTGYPWKRTAAGGADTLSGGQG